VNSYMMPWYGGYSCNSCEVTYSIPYKVVEKVRLKLLSREMVHKLNVSVFSKKALPAGQVYAKSHIRRARANLWSGQRKRQVNEIS